MHNLLKNLCMMLLVLCNPTIAMEGPAKKLKTELEESESGESVLGEQLFWAVHHHDEKEVQALVQAGAPLDWKYHDDDETPVMEAASFGDLAVLDVLLKAGVEVNIEPWTGSSVLNYAIEFHHKESVAMLIKAGADMYHVDYGGVPILEHAAYGFPKSGKALEICELLVEKMLSIPDDYQKKRLYTFLGCLKYNKDPRLRHLYSIRSMLKEPLRALIREANAPRVRAEINKLETSEIKEHLLNRFFPEEAQ